MVSGTNLRALFSQRKKRTNAGIKRGPRKPKVLAPTNVIVVNNGGVAHVAAPPKQRKTRSNKGVKRGPRGTVIVAPINNGLGLAGMKIVGQRKTRSNKGVKRGPRWMPRNTNLFN